MPNINPKVLLNAERDFSPKTLAAMMEISVSTVYRLIKSGNLEIYKVGKLTRIRAASVEKLRRSGKVAAAWAAE